MEAHEPQCLSLEDRLTGGVPHQEGLQVQSRFCLVAVDLKVHEPILCTQFICNRPAGEV